jgi:predicted ATPase
LSLPEPTSNEPKQLEASDAVRLFVARVRAHLPDFTLSARNGIQVAEICRRLDGLPLALELVAPHVETLGLAEVVARLSDGFRLAVRPTRSAPAGQRTILATLEWSCGLLEQDELVLLRRLGVFVGGWGLDAAESVCLSDGIEQASIAEVLERLVAKSLVMLEHDELYVRYRLLEIVRAHVLQQLSTAGEVEAMRRAHAAYFMRLGERVEPLSVDSAQALLLQPEEGNLRAALEWAVERDQADLGLRLATTAFPFWMYSGHYAEGRVWLQRLLALPSATYRFSGAGTGTCPLGRKSTGDRHLGQGQPSDGRRLRERPLPGRPPR